MTFSRRQFLVLAGVASGAAVLVACSPPEPEVPDQAIARWTAGDAGLVAGVSADGRHLVDGSGHPVLILADTVWTMAAVYGADELAEYFGTRRGQGFNAVQVSSLPFHIDGENRLDGCVDGQQAFLDGDITRWDEDYWRRLDALLDAAAAHGCTVLLGAMGPLLSYGLGSPEESREFGRLLGSRYREREGVVWLFGVDYARSEWDQLDPALLACLDGIRDAGAVQPATVQYHNDSSLSADNPRWQGKVEAQAAYTYAPAHAVVRQGYQLDAGPVLLVETNFEDENNTGGPDTDPASIRRQTLWTYTSGGAYAAYGRRDVWQSRGDFLDQLTSTAVAQLGLVRAELETLDWTRWVPDLTDQVLMEGRGDDGVQGSQQDGTADPLESDLATCAATADRSQVVVYLPAARTVRLDLGGAVETRARWWDPTTGGSQDVVGDAGTYAPPDDEHEDGHTDWLLVVDTEPAG